MSNHLIVHEGHVATSLAVMQEEYLREFLPFANDILVTAGTRMRGPIHMEEEIEWVQGLWKKKDRHIVFAVLKHEGTAADRTYTYVGHTGLHGIQFPNAHASTGSILGNLDNLGKGTGTEAKLLLMYHAFQVRGLRKLTSQVKGFNAQSLGHLIKAGYRIVGRFTKHEFHEGNYVDEILLEVFREDWEPIWEKYQTARELPKLTEEQRDLVKRETTAN